jgi:gamma-glutamyltranspeptidase/glutathione hydrolase
MREGSTLGAGDVYVQTDLARTLETIAEEGADSFYRGHLARLSADFYAKQKGLLRYEDLASYRAEEADPIKTTFEGIDVYQSAPNSQGIVMLMALNILEGWGTGWPKRSVKGGTASLLSTFNNLTCRRLQVRAP